MSWAYYMDRNKLDKTKCSIILVLYPALEVLSSSMRLVDGVIHPLVTLSVSINWIEIGQGFDTHWLM